MSAQWIRSRVNGMVFPYNEVLAENPVCEVISEEEAFPEKFMPAHARKRKRGPQQLTLDLTTEDIPEPPGVPEEVRVQASRGLP
jgi:hypothetical protein